MINISYFYAKMRNFYILFAATNIQSIFSNTKYFTENY